MRGVSGCRLTKFGRSGHLDPNFEVVMGGTAMLLCVDTSGREHVLKTDAALATRAVELRVVVGPRS